MKRVLGITAILILGVGLFWWGQQSRKGSSVMSTSSEVVETSAKDVEEVEAPAAVPEESSKGSASASLAMQQQRSAANTGVNEEMQPRDISNRPPTTYKPTGTPDSEHLIKTPLVLDTKWKVWSGVTAVETRSFNGDKSAVLAVMGGYSVIADESVNGDDRNFSSQKPLVFFDERMSRTGIVTGDLKVSLKEGVNPEAVATDHGLSVTSSLENIRLFFMRASADRYDLGGLVNNLKKDPRVSAVELSIVSRNYEKF